MPPPPKTDAPPAAAAAAKPEKAPPAPVAETAASASAATKPAGGLAAWLPAIVSVIVAPAATWATAQFVIVPRLEKKLALPPAAELASATLPAAEAVDKDGKPKPPSTYEFTNVVVNLAGTMGTRYLKTSFYVAGPPKSGFDIKKVFEDNRTKLYDTTLNVLSSLTLADIEEAGSKNVIREKLVSAYNQVLNQRVADQIYFSDFVVQ
jgi:flagellar protein FliL